MGNDPSKPEKKKPGPPKGVRIGGRPKGTSNKNIKTARENMNAVFVRLGGTAAMAKWARENLTEFYKMYARLIPVEVTGKDGGAIQLEVRERDELRNTILAAAEQIAQDETTSQLH